ncbi:MAG: hypothetical protein OEL75_02540 [Kiritimatiellaceae bacterium]|nr:hypothetical protein [Kiritimatiellaceae bacterium]
MQQSFIVHGMGPDAVGLIGKITAPISTINGNILDLRQDVIHGLFTIYLIIDLSESNANFDQLKSTVTGISAETGISLTAKQYDPVARAADKTNLLMVLIGKDKPGIIAASSEMLGKYNANIEFSQTIGREGVFLMELLTDVSNAQIPIENLKKTISKNMEALSIQTVFQQEDVFNKRKRVILFNINSSFLAPNAVAELMEQAELTTDSLPSGNTAQEMLSSSISKLDGLPLDVIEKLLSAVTPSAGSAELIQTLKIMGYKIALASTGFSFFTDYLKKRLDIDHAFGTPVTEDDDARILTGPAGPAGDIDSIITCLAAKEHVDLDDVTIITDAGSGATPGIRLELNLGIWLDCLNRHIISRNNLAGLIGSFGICN